MLLRVITNSIIGTSLLFLGSVSNAGDNNASWSWAANTNLTSPGYQTTEQLVPQVINSVVIITSMGVQEAAPGSVERTTPKPEEKTPENDNSVEEFLEEGSLKFTKIDNHLSPMGQGTGFFVAKNIILTNHHVIEKGVQDEYIVQIYTFKYKWYKARVIAADEKTDLAILEITNPDENSNAVKPLKFAEAEDWTLGEKLFAIGHPHGLYWTVTEGVLSHPHRRISSPWQWLIQTDTSVNPGNSGGPLFNMRGEVVGVNVLLLGRTEEGNPVDSGLNFAVRSDLAEHVAEELRVYKRVRRPRIGMSVQNRPDDNMGIIVDEITDESPAERSDLLSGDIITYANDVPINTTYDFFIWFTQKMPGDKVTLKVERTTENKDGPQTFSLNITVLLEELTEID
jgi:S1-C subfamily serine protease